MVYAYIRVSKKDQNLDRQLESVCSFNENIKIQNIYSDKQSGKNFERKNYNKLKSVLKRGDELIIHELDRFGRNKEQIKNELECLKIIGVIPRILNIPTTLYSYPDGQGWLADMVNNILFEVYGTLAQQERETISKRTKEGLESARKKGNYGGRPRIHSDKIKKAFCLYKNKKNINYILNYCKISKGTFYNYLKSYIKDLSISHNVNEISFITGANVKQINKYIQK